MLVRAAFVTVLVLLGACRREPSFDERYAETEKRIAASAAAIDREIAGQASGTPPASSEPLTPPRSPGAPP